MNKFLNYIKRNRVVFALLAVILICLIIIVVFGFRLLWGETGTTKYGTRLDNVEELSKTQEDMFKLYFLNDENVNTVTLNTEGRVIYLIIDFKEDYKLSKAKKLVKGSLEEIDGKVLSTYDIQFILTCKDVEDSKYYPTMGYKASSKEAISWINR